MRVPRFPLSFYQWLSHVNSCVGRMARRSLFQVCFRRPCARGRTIPKATLALGGLRDLVVFSSLERLAWDGSWRAPRHM